MIIKKYFIHGMNLEFINSLKGKHTNVNKMIMKNYFNHGMNLKIINSLNEKNMQLNFHTLCYTNYTMFITNDFVFK